MAQLGTLPNELLVTIAYMCPDQDRRRLERTDKRFYGLMQSLPALRPHTLVIGMGARLNTLQAHLRGRPLEDITFCNMTTAANNLWMEFTTCSTELAKCPQLQTLRLGDFPLHDRVPYCEFFSIASRLTALDVSFNQDERLRRIFIPPYLPNLRKCSVRGCNWLRTGQLYVDAQDDIATRLQWIDVRDTDLDHRVAVRLDFLKRFRQPRPELLCVVISEIYPQGFVHIANRVPCWITRLSRIPLHNVGVVLYHVSESDAIECTEPPMRELNFWD